MDKPMTLNIGAEYDADVITALRDVLRSMTPLTVEKDWGLAGSQELETLTVSVMGHAIVVEIETYIGITLTGDEDTVRSIASRVKERLGK